jgi:hypothetical protein
MPFHVYRGLLANQEIIYHDKVLTLDAATDTARELARVMSNAEFVALLMLDGDINIPMPNETGEKVYFPHGPETKWSHDHPLEVKVVLPVFDMMVFAIAEMKKLDEADFETMRALIMERAQTNPKTSTAMMGFLDAVIMERHCEFKSRNPGVA